MTTTRDWKQLGNELYGDPALKRDWARKPKFSYESDEERESRIVAEMKEREFFENLYKYR